MTMKNICVLGLGYIGLPTASIAATKGHKVIGVDVNPEVVNVINKGQIHIVEPDLDVLVKAAVTSGNLVAQRKPTSADVFIICVPTPIKANKEADLSFVQQSAEAIIPYVKKGNLIILESTIPPGTMEDVVIPIISKSGLQPGVDIFFAHCPERVLPGNILMELVENHRIIGGLDETSGKLAKEFYASFVQGQIHLTDLKTAEMVKLSENAFRDVNIAFANELSKIADKFNLNVWEVIRLANYHPRVNILKPGPGVGGHCIAVDPWFIIEKAPDEAKLMKTTRNINDSMPERVVQRIEASLSQLAEENPVIAVLGLAFKADIDDVRESPAIEVVEKLLAKNVSLKICDPYVNRYNSFETCSLEEAVKDADCLLILVDHKQFKEADKEKLLSSMRNKIVVDTRGIF